MNGSVGKGPTEMFAVSEVAGRKRERAVNQRKSRRSVVSLLGHWLTQQRPSPSVRMGSRASCCKTLKTRRAAVLFLACDASLKYGIMLLVQLSATAWTDSKPSQDFYSDASVLPKYQDFQSDAGIRRRDLSTFSLLASRPASGTAHITFHS
eukprot:148443-Pleurochrysis_carterae.AAC.1